MQGHHLAVIATVAPNCLPQAAVVGISVKPNLELLFGTSRNTRKYRNLQNSPMVAAVIGWEKGRSAQYEGEVKELAGKELEECLRVYLAEMPSAAKFMDPKESVFYKIIPRFIKYIDISRDPWDIFELYEFK